MNCNNLAGDMYSLHKQGCNVAFADGAVHYIRASTDINVMASLVTACGTEMISIPD
jgi:prepilin-type processing-associated H-X9-DG protein